MRHHSQDTLHYHCRNKNTAAVVVVVAVVAVAAAAAVAAAVAAAAAAAADKNDHLPRKPRCNCSSPFLRFCATLRLRSLTYRSRSPLLATHLGFLVACKHRAKFRFVSVIVYHRSNSLMLR